MPPTVSTTQNQRTHNASSIANYSWIVTPQEAGTWILLIELPPYPEDAVSGSRRLTIDGTTQEISNTVAVEVQVLTALGLTKSEEDLLDLLIPIIVALMVAPWFIKYVRTQLGASSRHRNTHEQIE